MRRGNRASARLIELLDSGPIDLTDVRCSCTQSAIANGKCDWGRRCGRLTVNGKDVGDTLIAEGLAVASPGLSSSLPGIVPTYRPLTCSRAVLMRYRRNLTPHEGPSDAH
jgi:endonuclease YncB( thermonuclease family)